MGVCVKYGFRNIKKLWIIFGNPVDFVSCLYYTALEKTNEKNGKPWVIVQKSVKGKGVSFMEDKASWHGSAPNDEQYAQAMEELNAIAKELEAK